YDLAGNGYRLVYAENRFLIPVIRHGVRVETKHRDQAESGKQRIILSFHRVLPPSILTLGSTRPAVAGFTALTSFNSSGVGASRIRNVQPRISALQYHGCPSIFAE